MLQLLSSANGQFLLTVPSRAITSPFDASISLAASTKREGFGCSPPRVDWSANAVVTRCSWSNAVTKAAVAVVISF